MSQWQETFGKRANGVFSALRLSGLFRFGDRHAGQFAILLIVDLLTFLTALWHHYKTQFSGPWAWYILAAMVVVTVVFLIAARQEDRDDVIQGLPPEYRDNDDERS